MEGFDERKDIVDMNQINLQAHTSHKGKHRIHQMRQSAQHLAAEQHQRDGQRNIDHPLHEQRKASAQAVFECDAGICVELCKYLR